MLLLLAQIDQASQLFNKFELFTLCASLQTLVAKYMAQKEHGTVQEGKGKNRMDIL